MSRFFVILLLITSSLFATDYNGEIYTWGYIDIIYNMLLSIRMLVENQGLGPLFKAALGIAFLLFTFKKAMDGRSNPGIEFGKMMLLAAAIWYLFLNAPNDAKHRYIITDKVTNEQKVVEQVPTGIGVPLQIITELEDKIITLMEKNFILPNSTTYRNSGIGYPLHEQIILSQVNLPDIYFQRTFNEFIKNCTMNEISDGSKSLTTLVSTNNLLSELDPIDDSRLTNVYSESDPDGKSEQCTDAYDYINDYFKNKGIDGAINLASALLNTDKDTLLDRTGGLVKLFYDAADNAREYIQQNIVTNMVKNALGQLSETTGLSDSTKAYSAAITKTYAMTQFANSGLLAAEYLPIIKGVLLAIVVGLSWIMALFAVMFQNFNYIRMYFILLLWLLLWSPILVIINYVGDIFASNIFTQIAKDTGQHFTLYTGNKIFETSSQALAWLGYLVWLVPPLAYAIAQASERGFVSLASSLSSSASTAAGAGASAVQQLGTQTNPSIRVGDSIYNEMAGANNIQRLESSFGHNYNVNKSILKDGSTTANISNGIGEKGNVTFGSDGSIKNANYSSPNMNANVSKQLTAQAKETLTKAKAKQEQAINTTSNELSGSINEALNKNETVTFNATKATNKNDRIALSKDIANSMDKAFSNNKEYDKYHQIVDEMAAKGKLQLSFNKADGQVEISLLNNNGERTSFKVNENEMKKFSTLFAKKFSNDLSNSSSLRNDFSKVASIGDSQTTSEVNKNVEQLSKTSSELEQAQKVLDYTQSHSATMAKNALSSIFEDFVKDGLEKGLDKDKAVEYAMAEMDNLQNDPDKLMYLINKQNQSIDNIKEELTEKGNNLSKDVDKNINKAENKAKETKNNIKDTKDNINSAKKQMNNIGDNLKKETQANINEFDKNQFDSKLNATSTDFTNNIKNSLNKGKEESLIGDLLKGSVKKPRIPTEDWKKTNKPTTYEKNEAKGNKKYTFDAEIIDEEKNKPAGELDNKNSNKQLPNNSDKLSNMRKDVSKLPNPHGGLTEYNSKSNLPATKENIRGALTTAKNEAKVPSTTKGSLSMIENVGEKIENTASKAGKFLKFGGAIGAGITVYESVKNITEAVSIAKDIYDIKKEQEEFTTHQFEGIEKHDYLIGDDYVSIKTKDGNIDTNVKWEDWNNYVKNHPDAANLSNNQGIVLPAALHHIESPKELVDYLQSYTIPKNSKPVNSVEEAVKEQLKTSIEDKFAKEVKKSSDNLFNKIFQLNLVSPQTAKEIENMTTYKNDLNNPFKQSSAPTSTDVDSFDKFSNTTGEKLNKDVNSIHKDNIKEPTKEPFFKREVNIYPDKLEKESIDGGAWTKEEGNYDTEMESENLKITNVSNAKMNIPQDIPNGSLKDVYGFGINTPFDSPAFFDREASNNYEKSSFKSNNSDIVETETIPQQQSQTQPTTTPTKDIFNGMIYNNSFPKTSSQDIPLGNKNPLQIDLNYMDSKAINSVKKEVKKALQYNRSKSIDINTSTLEDK